MYKSINKYRWPSTTTSPPPPPLKKLVFLRLLPLRKEFSSKSKLFVRRKKKNSGCSDMLRSGKSHQNSCWAYYTPPPLWIKVCEGHHSKIVGFFSLVWTNFVWKQWTWSFRELVFIFFVLLQSWYSSQKEVQIQIFEHHRRSFGQLHFVSASPLHQTLSGLFSQEWNSDFGPG